MVATSKCFIFGRCDVMIIFSYNDHKAGCRPRNEATNFSLAGNPPAVQTRHTHSTVYSMMGVDKKLCVCVCDETECRQIWWENVPG